MDEQLIQMKLFQEALEQFNQNLSASWREVETAYEQLAPQWQNQDENRQKHELIWNSLQETRQNYLNRQGRAYSEFLARKLRILEGYLTGE